MKDSSNNIVFWWSVIGRDVETNTFVHHIFRARSEPDAREMFQYICGCENPVEIINIIWSRSEIADGAVAPFPETVASEPPDLFWTQGQCVHGPMRMNHTSTDHFFLRAPTQHAAETVAHSLNEFAHVWLNVTHHHKRALSIHSAFDMMVAPNQLERMVGICGRDVVERFMDAARELHDQGRLEKRDASLDEQPTLPRKASKPKVIIKRPKTRRTANLITVDALLNRAS